MGLLGAGWHASCPLPWSHNGFHLPRCAQIMRAGTDVTLIGFGKMVGYNLKAAELLEAEGISAEVLNLRRWAGCIRAGLAVGGSGWGDERLSFHRFS